MDRISVLNYGNGWIINRSNNRLVKKKTTHFLYKASKHDTANGYGISYVKFISFDQITLNHKAYKYIRVDYKPYEWQYQHYGLIYYVIIK